MNEPYVHVGIVFDPQIEFTLLTPYQQDGRKVDGHQTVTFDHGRILWQGRLYDELLFEPEDEQTASFELHGVTIGINFHWERKEDQRFQGALRIIVEDNHLTAVNVIRVEDYLTSVISSEMSATASLELLKAHAVISRSWLLAQINKNKEIASKHTDYSACTQTDDELIRWFDREDHTRFDVCADDHCQRYQGITRASTDIVRQAIRATRGQVLTSDGRICDARFSKVPVLLGRHALPLPAQATRPPHPPGTDFCTRPCPARPHHRSRSRPLDTHLARGLLQHHGQAYSLAGT